MADSPSEQLQELLAGYVLGNLSSEEAESLRQLVLSRPELMHEVQQLQEVLSTMPYGLPEVAPPPQLRDAILAATHGTAAPTSSRWRQFALLGGSAAAVLLLALGWDNLRLRQQVTTIQAQITQQRDLIAALREPKTQLISLKGTNQLATASGRAVIAPGSPSAILVLQNLPDLTGDRYYCLWAIVEGKKPIAIGDLAPNPQGKVFMQIPLESTSGLKGMAVTIEVLPKPEGPQGPMVMTSSL